MSGVVRKEKRNSIDFKLKFKLGMFINEHLDLCKSGAYEDIAKKATSAIGEKITGYNVEYVMSQMGVKRARAVVKQQDSKEKEAIVELTRIVAELCLSLGYEPICTSFESVYARLGYRWPDEIDCCGAIRVLDKSKPGFFAHFHTVCDAIDCGRGIYWPPGDERACMKG
jgi:hypothetical protein